jgi:hypothetical protein
MATERVGMRGIRWGVVAAATGIAFAVLAFIAFLIAGGPDDTSAEGIANYFAENDGAVEWQAVLFGLSGIFFVWFAGTLAAALRTAEPDAGARLGGIALAGAAASTALYFVAISAWTTLAHLFGEASAGGFSDEALGDSLMLFNLADGALAMASFTAAIFVGAASVALLSARIVFESLALVGGLVVALLVVNAFVQLLGDTDSGDLLGRVSFLAFLAWVLAASILLTRWWSRAVTAAPSARISSTAP